MSSTQIALKNTVGKVFVRAYNEITGADKTGDAANITCQVSLDGGAYAASNDTNPTEVDATDDPGLYYFDNTAAEVNGVMSVWRAVSATADIKLSPVDVSVAPNFTDGSTVMDLEQLIIKPAGSNLPAIDLLGSGTGDGIRSGGGMTGIGMKLTGGGTSGAGLSVTSGNDVAMTVVAVGTNKAGLSVSGIGTGAGIYAVGGATGEGMELSGGSSSVAGLKMVCGGGSHAFDAIVSSGAGNAINTSVDSGDHLSSGIKADINTEVDTAFSDYDPPTKAEMDSAHTTTDALVTGVDGKVDTVDAVVDLIKIDTAGTHASAVYTEGIVDLILNDTAEIGTAGAGLTNITWNGDWDAQVESECTDALNNYDPPTKAELDSAVTTITTSVAGVDGKVDAVPTAVQNVAALMADTGFTAGGTTTYADFLKILASWSAGDVRDKSGSTGVVEYLDLDNSTVVYEVDWETSTPYRTSTVV